MGYSVNKAILVGNIGQEPEIRYTGAGDAVANFSVATSETWKDKNTGEKKEHTEWHRCVCFGKTAEYIGEYLHKGNKVYIEGNIKTRSYDKDGEKRYATEIKVNQIINLTQREGHGTHTPAPAYGAQAPTPGPGAQGDYSPPPAPGHSPVPGASPEGSRVSVPPAGPADYDDDIPF